MNVPSTPPLLWSVPYQRNPFFTGREEILGALARGLRTENAVALSHPLGISGLGGIGKTQTALEYAHRYRAEYDAVLWVQADSITTLTSSFIDVAHLLELPERNERDQDIIIEAVLRWFRIHTRWLLILDGLDDLSIAESFLPKAGQGHLLFTTRSHALGGIAQRLDVGQMEPEAGALLLLRRASIIPLPASLDRARRDDRKAAHEISQELDGLPLALDQAGAYIKETPYPLTHYLDLYQARHQDLLQARGNFDQDYPASVATTWSLAFEKVRQANVTSTELLNFCAFLAPSAIPEEIIRKGAPHLGPILSPVATDHMQLDLACKEVLRFSLLRRGADERILTMHRLVQAVLRDTMDDKVRQQWAQQTVLAVNESFPEVEFSTWQECERALPHAQVCATYIKQRDFAIPEAARLLNQAGLYLKERGQYTEAELLYQDALSIRERLGAEHPETAESLNNLAVLYENQGKFEQAEGLYQRALAIKEQLLGATHTDTATSLNNLATLHHNQGKYEQAEPLYQRALSIYEDQLGPDHLNTANCLNNLAALYDTQGKYDQAEPLLVRALSIRKKQLGPDHPDTTYSLNNLALLYENQGKYEQAEPLYRHALSIREQQHGHDHNHPDIAQSLNNLGSLYRTQGKYEEAEPMLVRALAIDEQAAGPDHPDVAADLNNLALLYMTQGKYEQAEPLLVRALAICEGHLGHQHPHTAVGRGLLARLYMQQDKYSEAEPLLQQTLAVFEQSLGPEHPHTATCVSDLAALYQAQGNYERAKSLYERALSIRARVLESDHPRMRELRESYASLLRSMELEEETKQLEEHNHFAKKEP